MNLHPQSKTGQSGQCLGKKPIPHFVIILLFVAALGIRLYHINRPPLDFAPIRQYQNAHIIRGLYYETDDSISDSRKRIAKLNMERMGFVLEPRIIETASIAGYRLMGAEHLWIPRVLSSIFWVVGGFFLYLIALKFFSPGISLFSTFFYLFLPYSILASRSIQPDPLMVMMMLFSIQRVLEYDANPSLLNLITAAIVTAIAVLIKPYCIFMIFGAFISLAIHRRGFWRALFDRHTLIFTFLIIVPTIVYYAYGLFTNVGFLGEHARGSFLPHLILYPPFWRGWLQMIGDVVGYIAFFLAILGLLKIKREKAGALLLGLWIGYFLFGLSATYQMHTHSYYHMPFIPIIALSLAPIVTMVVNGRTPLLSNRKSIFTIMMIVSVGIIVGLGFIIRTGNAGNISPDYKNMLKTAAAITGINPEFRKFLNDDFERQVAIAKEIGELVDHSTNTLFLTPYFGRVIAYHGEFAGLPWPTSRSLYGRRLRGVKVPNIKEDFTSESVEILYQGKFIQYTPDYFIITEFKELEKQTDLKDFLNANFPIIAQNKDYLIFDLRKMSRFNR